MVPSGHANQRLRDPADSRPLIVNADDFGMCQAVNQASTGGLDGCEVRLMKVWL